MSITILFCTCTRYYVYTRTSTCPLLHCCWSFSLLLTTIHVPLSTIARYTIQWANVSFVSQCWILLHSETTPTLSSSTLSLSILLQITTSKHKSCILIIHSCDQNRGLTSRYPLSATSTRMNKSTICVWMLWSEVVWSCSMCRDRLRR